MYLCPMLNLFTKELDTERLHIRFTASVKTQRPCMVRLNWYIIFIHGMKGGSTMFIVRHSPIQNGCMR